MGFNPLDYLGGAIFGPSKDDILEPGGDDLAEATEIQKMILREIMGKEPPVMPEQTFEGQSPLTLSGYREGPGLQVTPEMLVDPSLGQGDSAWFGGGVDPTGRNVQLGAIDYFGNLAQGGPDAAAEADYARRAAQAQQASRSARDAALTSLETRGQAGSGAGLLADLVTGQQAAGSMNMAGMQAAADAQMRRDAAAREAAGLGGDVRSSDFDELARTRDSQDAWKQWWGEQDLDAQKENSQRYADAGYENWSRGNEVGDKNVDMQNQTYQTNSMRPQMYYDNWLQKMNLATGQGAGVASSKESEAANAFDPKKVFGDFISGYSGAGGFK